MTLDNQQGSSFGVATVFLDYPEGVAFISGSGEDSQVQAAVTGRPTTGSPTCVVFDRDHGVQFGCFSIPGFPDGQLFRAAFNDCQSATPLSANDFTCTVIEAASTQSVEVPATCTVTIS